MDKKASVAIWLWFFLALSCPTSDVIAQDFLLSGGTTLAILDGNGNGPDMVNDCYFEAYTTNGTDIHIMSKQDLTTPLLGCSGFYTGVTGLGFDDSSDFGEVRIDTSSVGGKVPVKVEFVDETENTDGPPLEMNDPDDEVALLVQDEQFDDPHDKGLFCDENGFALKITSETGVSVLWPVEMYPNASSPTHVRVLNIPLEKLDGQDTLVDAYVPVNPDKTITWALSNDPDVHYVRVDLDNLPPCPEDNFAVPAVTEWGIIALVLSLLALGIWVFRRQRLLKSFDGD